ncbi:hypothetical protein [Streptomyces virginiae]|uniref:hypothetical protein n=1 Tax=Streptomyces virginiae TaxID=1961 RepID=UPI00224E929D|nr:hypothetical protein [Streptomyces virginiae]MCX4960516.1 hypothetical protein [Streptomyces virginiae]
MRVLALQDIGIGRLGEAGCDLGPPPAAGDVRLLARHAPVHRHRNCLSLPQPTSHTAGAVAREPARTPSDPRTATEWAENLDRSA